MNNGTDCEPDPFRKMLHYCNYILEIQYYVKSHLDTIQTYCIMSGTKIFDECKLS